MKKVYLTITLLGMFILMFLITLVPIQASSYQGITLQTEISELNDFTLEEIFRSYGHISNTAWEPASTSWLTTYEDDGVQLGAIYSGTAQMKNDTNKTLVNGHKYWYYSQYEIYQGGYVQVRIVDTNFQNEQYLYQESTQAQQSYKFSGTTTYNGAGTGQLRLSIFMTNQSVQEVLLLLNRFILLDLTSIGLENVSPSLIEYYYMLYVILIHDLDPTLFYNEGFNEGFNDGEDLGYLDGYANGYNDGQYDWGVLMPDEQTYFDPADAQSYYFNEGRDDAIDNNFTLMGLIELMIGVVLSMVGWIINIEIFNISIIGILSTLAVGIGVIWLLKILRG